MLREVLDVLELLDTPRASGAAVADALRAAAPDLDPEVIPAEGDRGGTDFVRLLVPGTGGRRAGGNAPTTGIVGRHGGSGARPARIGYVSDGDGAAAALAAALKLARMHTAGDRLPGDAIVASHVCPDAPTLPHEPVEFMGSPVDMATKNRIELDPAMDAVLSIDTTKGNRIVNHRGIAITPTVRQGWILRVSDDLVSILERVSGAPAVTLPLSMADITPYGNGLYHLNSIVQPATATGAPVVGVAITAASVVPGSATGASVESDIALAARFALEVAKEVGAGRARLCDDREFARLVELYGSMEHLQTPGRTPS